MIYMAVSDIRTGLLRISDDDHLGLFVPMPFRLPADANLNSPQVKLITDWNKGYMELNAEILEKYLHKDFRSIVYPRSLGVMERSKEEWVKHAKGVIGLSTEFDVGHTPCYPNSLLPAKYALQSTVLSIIETPGRVVLHVRIPTGLFD